MNEHVIELTEQQLMALVQSSPKLKHAMLKMAWHLTINEWEKLEAEFGPILGGTTGKIDVSVASIGTIASLEGWNCGGMNEVISEPIDMKPFDAVEFVLHPKVDDTQEFNLVRCPKCELMVEELVVTPYRHVCASCAKETK